MDSRPGDERPDDPPPGEPQPADPEPTRTESTGTTHEEAVAADTVRADTVPDWLRPPVIGALRRHRRRWVIAWYSFAVVVIVVLTTILVWPHRFDSAEQRVQGFLSAVRQGKVARARAMTADPPVHTSDDDAGTPFLTADVLRQNWQIDSVRSVDEVDDYSTEARVDATISAPNVGTASYRFSVTRHDDGAAWKVQDPYAYVYVRQFPLRYVTINGHRVQLPSQHGQTAPGGRYVLFPGVYRFFDRAPESVRHSSTAHLLMPGNYVVSQPGVSPSEGSHSIVVPRMTLTGAAQRSAQRAVDAYLDDCAKTTVLTTPGCPFGAEYVPEPGKPDRVFFDDEVTSMTWSVTHYPVVTVEPYGGEFVVVDRRPGTVKLTATGTDRDTGFTAKTSITCGTNDNVLRVDITPSGTFRVYPEGGRYGTADVDQDRSHWETC